MIEQAVTSIYREGNIDFMENILGISNIKNEELGEELMLVNDDYEPLEQQTGEIESETKKSDPLGHGQQSELNKTKNIEHEFARKNEVVIDDHIDAQRRSIKQETD